jgi:nucleotide-binding universal stress UspA family protein
MKILIAYDGSDYADIAIDDLQWAGMPKNAQAIVLTAVEWPLQAPRSWGMVDTGFATELEEHIKAAEHVAEQGRRRLHQLFPNWKIHSAAAPAGLAATAILEKAEAWPADLIVAGTRGRSALVRAVLGSVSLKLVKDAKCSVRIGRPSKHDGPIRLFVGNDGSHEAETAIDAICRRTWPPGTSVRILAVHEALVAVASPNVAMAPDLYGKINEDERVRLQDVSNQAALKLQKAGLAAFPSLIEGDPKGSLVNEAQDWKASTIFVGACGRGGVERLLLGSVSSATVAHAHCTVEVVR